MLTLISRLWLCQFSPCRECWLTTRQAALYKEELCSFKRWIQDREAGKSYHVAVKRGHIWLLNGLHCMMTIIFKKNWIGKINVYHTFFFLSLDVSFAQAFNIWMNINCDFATQRPEDNQEVKVCCCDPLYPGWIHIAKCTLSLALHRDLKGSPVSNHPYRSFTRGLQSEFLSAERKMLICASGGVCVCCLLNVLRAEFYGWKAVKYHLPVMMNNRKRPRINIDEGDLREFESCTYWYIVLWLQYIICWECEYMLAFFEFVLFLVILNISASVCLVIKAFLKSINASKFPVFFVCCWDFSLKWNEALRFHQFLAF